MVKIPQFLIIALWLTYLTSLFQVFSIAKYGVTLTDLIMGAIIIWVIFQIIIQKKPFKFQKGILANLLYLSAFASLISGIGLIFWGGSIEINQFAKSFIHYLFLIFFTFIFLIAETDNEAFYNTIKVVLIVAFFVNIFGIYQIFARLYDLPYAWIKITNVSFEQRGMKEVQGETQQLALQFGNFYRATSIFPEPSALAYYNIFNLIYIVVPFLKGSKPFIKNQILNLIVFISVVIGLLAPFSLSGLSAIILFLVSLIFLEKIKVSKFIIPLVLLITVVVIFDIYFQNMTHTSIIQLFYERVSGLLSTKAGMDPLWGESTPGRLKSFKNAFELFLTSPIVGIGMGNTYYHPLSQMRFADSSAFAILAEMGIFGIAVFLALLFFVAKIGLFMRKKEIISIVTNEKLKTVQFVAIYVWIMLIYDACFLAGIHGTPYFWMPMVMVIATYRSVLKNLDQNNLDLDKLNLSNYKV
ncbi:MAG: O-antigen ligase family protein [Chloroherpetonaceae bacterium]|nr:O-antigen ligase family protein [bacterium]